ncbi:anti-sigma factor [Lignipirellula cremea]|uniref:Uncharacterized protein n=1 Tax=Lignipirellula cremea TaxID=2528010 RepID=A0A518E4X7_9BACT|nr:hypothetical protein [Lignipirellula cremea]QDU99145.1 hypothetical protein Pla8534_70570 [Lignipirellula cremea]
MKAQYTQKELEAYLDEALSPGDMAQLEQTVREQPELGQRLAEILQQRDAGVHSLGAIWRRHRVSCPAREQLGSFLLGALGNEEMHYIHFHILQVGCRYCSANLEDLRRRQEEDARDTAQRRRKYLESSAGYLRPKKR